MFGESYVVVNASFVTQQAEFTCVPTYTQSFVFAFFLVCPLKANMLAGSFHEARPSPRLEPLGKQWGGLGRGSPSGSWAEKDSFACLLLPVTRVQCVMQVSSHF